MSLPRLLCAVVLLLWPAIGSAQQEAAAQQQPPAANSDAISLFAVDRQEWVGEVWRGVGEVRILYQDIKIQCDEIEYNRATMELVARGNVIMDQGPKRFAAAELHYNLRSKSGYFIDCQASMPPSYHFDAARLDKLDETHYRLEDATFTSCEGQEVPPWDFKLGSGTIEEEGYGRFRDARLRIKHLPVFYLPYVLWPVKQERALGMLMPSFGYSQIRGAYLGNSLFVPVGRSYDTTFFLDLFSEKYVGLGNQWRWAPVDKALGELTGYAIRDPDSGDWEWKVNGTHQQDDFLGFRLQAELHELSDIDFFQEFERNFNQNALRSLYSFVYMTRSWGPYALNLRADRRTTFLSANEVMLSQLPELELRVRSTRIGNSDVYWSMVSSLNYFTVDRGGDLRGSYPRVDLFPSVSYTLPGPLWLTVTPRLGGRASWWGSRYTADRTSLEEESIDRSYLTGGVDIVGPSFSRIFTRPLGSFVKFKHLVEPRIEYEYLSDQGKDDKLIPVFDEVDSARPTSRARITLANRLFGRTKDGLSARELGTFELYQDLSFSEPLSYGAAGASSDRGPLGAALRITPSPGITVDGRASWDVMYDTLRSTSISSGIFLSGVNTALTWYQGFSPASGERSSSQARLMLGYRTLDFPLSGNIQLNFDIEKGEMLQQQIELHYEGSCWGITAEYRDLRIGLYPTRDVRIIISLKDVGALPEIKGSLDDLAQ